MELNFGSLNWIPILVCVVVAQAFLTVWFVVLFGDPWAKAYGAADKKQHTSEIPGYTYGIGLVCAALLTIGLAVLQQGMGIATFTGGVMFGVLMAICFAIATALPGYAFMKRWDAGVLAIGSQSVLIVILSIILAAWPF